MPCHGSGQWSPASHWKPEFNPRSVCVVPMVDKVAMGEVSLKVLQLLLPGIISPMFHTHSFNTKAIESQLLTASLNNTLEKTYLRILLT